MQHLRARYLNTGIGRFITRDTWGGDYNQPLSLNKWNYVGSNPINHSDPSGQCAPYCDVIENMVNYLYKNGCSVPLYLSTTPRPGVNPTITQWSNAAPPQPCDEYGNDNNGRRYCILYQGGYLDMTHFRFENKYDQLIRDLSIQQIGEPGSVNYSQSILGVNFKLKYRTNLPSKELSTRLNTRELKQIALSIFMDYQIRYESVQGADPRCKYGIPGCSSFSNEDLITDYLGFITASQESINFQNLIPTLGGGYASPNPPKGKRPKNYRFTSFLYSDPDTGNLSRRYLPRSLMPFRPINPGKGDLWDVPKFTMRADLFKWW